MLEWMSSPARVGIIGLGLGVALGVLIGYGIWPLEYTEVDLTDLSQSAQQSYILLVAQAFAYDGDLALARQRLASLEPTQDWRAVQRLAEEYLTRPAPAEKSAAALKALAEALRAGSP